MTFIEEILRFNKAVRGSGGSSRTHKMWNVDTHAELAELAPTHTAGQIGERLGYSASSVRKVCKIRGIALKPARGC